MTVQAIYGKNPIGGTSKLTRGRGLTSLEGESRTRMAQQVAELDEMEKAGLLQITERHCAPGSSEVDTVVYKRLK